MSNPQNKNYWIDTARLADFHGNIQDSTILIIGSNLAALSTAYWLLNEFHAPHITIVNPGTFDDLDFQAGHITLDAMYGNDIFQSPKLCKLMQHTEKFYKYTRQLCESIGYDDILDKYFDIQEDIIAQKHIAQVQQIKQLDVESGLPMTLDYTRIVGFNNLGPMRLCERSTAIQPAKLYNMLHRFVCAQGVNCVSAQITNIDTSNRDITVHYIDGHKSQHDILIICDYTITQRLFSYMLNNIKYAATRSIETFMVSDKLPVNLDPINFKVQYNSPLYGSVTQDNKLILAARSSYDTAGFIPPLIRRWPYKYINKINKEIKWDYIWTQSLDHSLPIVGAHTRDHRIGVCLNTNTMGSNWALGCSKYIVDIMLDHIKPVQLFKP